MFVNILVFLKILFGFNQASNIFKGKGMELGGFIRHQVECLTVLGLINR